MSEAILSIDNLTMGYTEEDLVLKDLSFTVEPGQIIGYIGPNGAGKSTTIKIILGMIKNYNGQVEVFGKDISECSIDYKRNIGYLPEAGTIYENLTGKEYLTFIGESYGLSYQEAEQRGRKLMNLFEIESSYQHRISSYSKGMKQKLLIIASLIHNPDLLFLDEPLQGLDANTVQVFRETLVKLAKQGKTIFYSSHIMEVVEKISDRILLLKDGQIVADGTFAELKEKSKEGTLADIFSQLTEFSGYEAHVEDFIATIGGLDDERS